MWSLAVQGNRRCLCSMGSGSRATRGVMGGSTSGMVVWSVACVLGVSEVQVGIHRPSPVTLFDYELAKYQGMLFLYLGVIYLVASNKQAKDLIICCRRLRISDSQLFLYNMLDIYCVCYT